MQLPSNPTAVPLKQGAISLSITMLSNYYRQAGAVYASGIATGHGLCCLKRKHYDDNKAVRTRRHIILYGPPGSCKSTISKFFLSKMAGGIDIFDPLNDAVIHTRQFPTYATISGSNSFERLRGTFGADGSIMAPILQEANWVYAPELLSFLGHSPNERSARIENLNGAFEEGIVSVSLAKGGNMDLEDRIEMASNIPVTANYTYDPYKCVLRYDCTASFIGCTRPIDAKLKKELIEAGYWSRHNIEEWLPSDTTARKYADDKFGSQPTPEALEALRQKWLDLWNTEFIQVNLPPNAMYKEVLRWFNIKLAELSKEIERPFSEMFNGRDDTNVLQLLTASAIDRLSASREPGDRTPVEFLTYTQADVEKAKSWIASHLFHMRNNFEAKTESPAEEKAKEAAQVALGFFLNSRDKEPDFDEFHSTQFVTYLAKFADEQIRVSERTARRYLAKLRVGRSITASRTSPGEYHVDVGAMAKYGYILVGDEWAVGTPGESTDDDEEEEEHSEEDFA